MRLARAECAGTTICRPEVEHGPGPHWLENHSIRAVCLICGKKGPWHRVIGPF